MSNINIFNPEIWEISDSTYESTFNLTPIRLDMAILACVEKGRIDLFEEIARNGVMEYLCKSLPEKEKWNGVMCFMCGAAFAYAVKGGLPHTRASAVSIKYTDNVTNIATAEDFAERRIDMYRDFTTEVHYARNIRTPNPVVNNAIMYIENHIDEKIKIADIAADCSYSHSGLQHLFSLHTGHSISDFIRKKKAEKACFLLMYTTLSCTKIAEKLSYSSQSHFIAQFSKEMGCTPGQYRKSHLAI